MNLEAIKAREKAASPGPWPGKPYSERFGSDLEFDHPQVVADRAFVAHARADIPALIARVEELTEALKYYAERDSKWLNFPGVAIAALKDKGDGK